MIYYKAQLRSLASQQGKRLSAVLVVEMALTVLPHLGFQQIVWGI